MYTLHFDILGTHPYNSINLLTKCHTPLFTPSVLSFCSLLLSSPSVLSFCPLLLSSPSVHSFCPLLLSTPSVLSFCPLLLSSPSVLSFCPLLLFTLTSLLITHNEIHFFYRRLLSNVSLWWSSRYDKGQNDLDLQIPEQHRYVRAYVHPLFFF